MFRSEAREKKSLKQEVVRVTLPVHRERAAVFSLLNSDGQTAKIIFTGLNPESRRLKEQCNTFFSLSVRRLFTELESACC